VSFYRERLDRAGVNPDSITSLKGHRQAALHQQGQDTRLTKGAPRKHNLNFDFLGESLCVTWW
jgi:hypothetical protein